MTSALQARVYAGPSAAESAQQYEADRAVARRYGYVPVSVTWEGSTLTVTYGPQASAVVPAATAAKSRPSPGRGNMLKAVLVAVLLFVPSAIAIGIGLGALGLADIRTTLWFDDGYQRTMLSFPTVFPLGILLALAVSIFAAGQWRKLAGPKQWLSLTIGAVLGAIVTIVPLLALVFWLLISSLEDMLLYPRP